MSNLVNLYEIEKGKILQSYKINEELLRCDLELSALCFFIIAMKFNEITDYIEQILQHGNPVEYSDETIRTMDFDKKVTALKNLYEIPENITKNLKAIKDIRNSIIHGRFRPKESGEYEFKPYIYRTDGKSNRAFKINERLNVFDEKLKEIIPELNQLNNTLKNPIINQFNIGEIFK